MIDWLVKQYYKIPKTKWRNPIRFEKRDSREFEWFKERNKYGFDERVMWNLGPTFMHLIRQFLKLKSSSAEIDYLVRDLSLEEFTQWVVMKDLKTLNWMSDRVTIYIEWQCPTFYLDGRCVHLPDNVQKDILYKVSNTLNILMLGKKINETEIKFLYDHAFHLGW